MSAQHADAAPAPHRVALPRKTKAIRAALTPEERKQFTTELDDSETGGLSQVVEKWWMHAAMNLSGTWDRIRDIEAGRARVIPIEDVFPELRTVR